MKEKKKERFYESEKERKKGLMKDKKTERKVL